MIATVSTPGTFVALSVLDEGNIDLAEFALTAEQRDTITAFATDGWRLVTLSHQAGDEFTAVFYERILANYDDVCHSIEIAIGPDGSYTPSPLP